MASSSSSDNAESIRRRTANDSENGVDQEMQENNTSPDPNTAGQRSNNVAPPPASPSPALPANGSRAGGGRRVLGTPRRPFYRTTSIVTTTDGIRIYAERDLNDEGSGSSSAGRGFDTCQMTIDLPLSPPRQPHPPRVPNQEAAQGGQAAIGPGWPLPPPQPHPPPVSNQEAAQGGEPGSARREDAVPGVRGYPDLPDLNLPPEEDGEN
ncbi:protein enabled [Capsicum galapagoense]